MSSILTQKIGGATHWDLDYTFHANGQINEITNRLDGNKSKEFTHDELGRLLTAASHAGTRL